ncbi:hypothetical protein AC578_6755 [Pseudocercospora eumusae]|uniref:Uncharacterized protein n=1 Tax=Pseudocercospora eumusae TaxID=321146 RepID=A0A139HA41_9PEZI|nr:hypothetical protein AC578_6755 [Pseudocercospora eumusae]
MSSKHTSVPRQAYETAYPFECEYCGFDDETLISIANEYADQMCMDLAYIARIYRHDMRHCTTATCSSVVRSPGLPLTVVTRFRPRCA